jgi:prohibitin 1
MARRTFPGIVLLALLAAGGMSMSCIGTGRVGVVTTFGRVTGRQLAEGINVVAPWQGVHRMDVRTKEIKEAAEVPSNEGLIVNLDTSLLFRLDASQASRLYQTVGPSYVDVIVTPNLRSAIRSATATYEAEALYSTAREQVALDIFTTMTEVLTDRGIIVENVLLRDVGLPQRLMDAIEAKQQAEQEALQMQFVLQKEEQEAERKRVEAAGIRDFQDIVTQGISDKLLAWKGIEATELLAQSSNAKVVIIGAGDNGLPIILGGSN